MARIPRSGCLGKGTKVTARAAARVSEGQGQHAKGYEGRQSHNEARATIGPTILIKLKEQLG